MSVAQKASAKCRFAVSSLSHFLNIPWARVIASYTAREILVDFNHLPVTGSATMSLMDLVHEHGL